MKEITIKIVSLFLILILIENLLFPMFSIAVDDNVIEIGTSEELWNFAKSMNEENNTYEGKIVRLTRDINLGCSSSKPWIPAGGISGYQFKGTFDGGFHTISNMYISLNDSTNRISRYGFIASLGVNSIVQNVNFGNCKIEKTNNSALKNEVYGIGILAGTGSGTITYCRTSSCEINLSNFPTNGYNGYNPVLGGIIGSINNGVIKKCIGVTKIYVTDSIKTSDTQIKTSAVAGGITASATNTEIECCISKGSITNKAGASGGIIGYGENAKVRFCRNTGEITAGSQGENYNSRGGGGIAGEIKNTNINGCGNNSNIIGVNYDYNTNRGVYLGGIVGEILSSSEQVCKIYNCYSIGNLSLDNSYNTISNVYETAPGYGVKLGGIIGFANVIYNKDIVELKNTYVSGTIANKGDVGSIVGYVYNNPKTFLSINLYTTNSGNTIGRKPTDLSASATVKSVSDMKTQSFVNLLNNGVDEFKYDTYNENNQYPILKNIDKIAPWLKVVYEKTDTSVKATIKADEQIQEITGWTLSSDKKALSKTYTTNSNESIEVLDLAGNSKSVDINITGLDGTPPTLQVSYSTLENTKDSVIVTIKADEQIQAPSGWTLGTDGKTITKTYLENTTEDVNVLDNAGNTSTVEIKVTNIDKIAPVLQVSYNNTSRTKNDVIATISSNEQIQAPSGWTLGTDGKTITKTYTENKTETVNVLDKVGNSSLIEVKVTNIDKVKPNLQVNYSTTERTKENVIVTITSNEEVQEVSGWTLSSDKKKLTKTYTSNVEETVNVSDLVGNKSTATVKIENIIVTGIRSNIYEIKDSKIKGIKPNSTFKNIKESFEIEAESIVIYSTKGEILKEDDVITTGTKIVLDEHEIYTFVVAGDINSDGIADTKDMLKINKYRLGKEELEGVYLEAGDVTGDGKVDTKDMLKINKIRLGKENI